MLPNCGPGAYPVVDQADERGRHFTEAAFWRALAHTLAQEIPVR